MMQGASELVTEDGGVSAYRDDLSRAWHSVNVPELERLALLVAQTLTSGNGVIVAGNGGSATTCQHIANDWTIPSKPDAPLGPVFSLVGNVAALTAIANDYSFEEVFSRQLIGLARYATIFVVFSVSGRSPNLVLAVEKAKTLGLTTVGLLGRSDGILSRITDYSVSFGNDYGLVEDLHLSFGHLVVRLLRHGNPHEALPSAGL